MWPVISDMTAEKIKEIKFCFEVIKNECSNIKRAAGIRKGYDATGEEPVEYLIELLSHEDMYTVGHLDFEGERWIMPED